MLISCMQKKCIGGGVADAAGGHHVDRAANTAALDGHDHRHAQGFELAEGGLQVGQRIKDGRAPLGALVIHVDRAIKGLQRHAGAKVPTGAADYQRPRCALPVQLGQHGIELAPEQRVHGVELGRPVQHQMGHMMFGAQREAVQGGGRGIHGTRL